MWKRLRHRVGAWRRPGIKLQLAAARQIHHASDLGWRLPVAALCLSLAVGGVAIALRLAGWLQLWELVTLDRFFRSRMLEPQDPRIAIVAIDETDIRNIGQWPAPDEKIAELLEKIKQQQPVAIGLDLYRDFPIEPGHQRLVEIFQTTPHLIGIFKVGNGDRGLEVNPPPVLSQLAQVAASDLVLDPDSTVRRGLLYLETAEGEVVDTLAMRLASMYLETQNIYSQPAPENPHYLQLGDTVFFPLKSNYGSYVRTYAGGYQIMMNFRGPPGSFEMVSMTDVLQGKISPHLFRDRLVLVGAIADSLQDLFNTSYSSNLIAFPEQTSGVEVHAHLTSQILSTVLDDLPLIRSWSDPVEYLWVFAWSVFGGMLVCKQRSCLRAAIALSLATSTLMAGGYYALLIGWWIPTIPAVLSLMGSGVAVTGYTAMVERQERQVMMNLFGRHVTPKIAEAIWQQRHQILKQGKIPAQQMTATVVFTDLKGFSRVAEKMLPEQLMDWLNDYMAAMSQVVLERDGAIDKFIGDAIMAVFGIPIPSVTEAEIRRDAVAAVNCALEMATRLQALDRQWRTRGEPTVGMRIGIATGPVVAGSLGCGWRSDYTIIGDTVNVAARLEAFNRSVNDGLCRILISEETYKYIKDDFSTKLIGNVLLRGRKQTTKVYQVLWEEN